MLIELTIRNIIDLPKIIEHIAEVGADEVALTDKNGMPDNLIAAEEIKKALPNLNITTYYSLKNHTSREVGQKYEHLKNYFTRVVTSGVGTILLVSGNPRPKFDTLEAIEYIKANDLKSELVSLAVAYNPFFEGAELVEEDNRLEKKANTGAVDKVFLQIGIDENALKKGVDNVRKLFPNAEIGASVMILTPFLMSRFEIRPWKGVMISDEFMSSVENALEINKKLLRQYETLGVKPIFGVYTITQSAVASLKVLL